MKGSRAGRGYRIRLLTAIAPEEVKEEEMKTLTLRRLSSLILLLLGAAFT